MNYLLTRINVASFKKSYGAWRDGSVVKAHSALSEDLSVDLNTLIRAAPNCLEVQV